MSPPKSSRPHRRRRPDGRSRCRRRRAAAPRPAPRASRARKRALLGVAALVAARRRRLRRLLLARARATTRRTDNAYVQGNVVQITPQVGGTVVAINADDTDFVKAGQPLVRLDPADAQVALDQAEAQLAQTVREVRTLFANNGTLKAQIALREADLARAQSDVARAQDDVSAARAAGRAPARSARKSSTTSRRSSPPRKSAVAAAQSARDAAREQLAIEPVADRGHPGRAASRTCCAPRRGCARPTSRSQRAELLAPVDGYVAKRSVQLGQRVQAGAPLMSVVALEPGLGRRQLQGRPAARTCASASRSSSRPTSTARRSTTTARSRASAPAPARRSRCCRRRTRPATGSRWCSACRCASRSTRRSSPSIRCASACRWTRRSTSRNTDGTHARRRRAAPARGADRASSTSGNEQADAEVQQDHRRQPRPRAAARRRAAATAPRRRAPRATRRHRSRTGAAAAAADALMAARDAVAAPRPAQPPPAPRRRRAAPQPRRAPPLHGGELVLGTIALSLATFMNVLDTSIANVSIPAIAGDLGVSPSQGTWVITSFAVANAISVPLTGWLTQRFGQVRLFTAQHPAVRDRVVAVRPGAEHRHADRLPRAAGPRRRADDPAVADAAAVELSARQGRHARWRCGR